MSDKPITIRKKDDNTIELLNPETKDTIDTKLELMKYTSEVQARIKKDITSDFVLARLDQKDKTGVIDRRCSFDWSSHGILPF